MKSILGIVPRNAKIEEGEILLEGKDLLKISKEERSSIKEIFYSPKHPYTKALLSAIPIPDPDRASGGMPLI